MVRNNAFMEQKALLWLRLGAVFGFSEHRSYQVNGKKKRYQDDQDRTYDCSLGGKKINRMENNMESTSHHLNKWYGFYNAMGRSSSCTCTAFCRIKGSLLEGEGTEKN